MRAAVALRDVVGEAQHVFVIAVIPFERDIDADAIALAGDGNRVWEERGLRPVQPFHKGSNPAFVIKLHFLLFGMARVDQEQAHARIEEGQLPKPMLELVKVKLGDLEGFRARQKGHARATLGAATFILSRRADHLERGNRIAVLELHIMFLPVAPNLEIEPDRERVDDGHANAVEPA